MDRFSLPATILIAVTVCASLAGCTVGSSDEYRTFEEVQAEKQSQAQNVASADDEPALPEDVDLDGSGGDGAPSDSIERAALDETPSSDAAQEELLATTVIRGGDDTSRTSDSVKNSNRAQLGAASDATDRIVPAEAATGNSASNADSASNGDREPNIGDAASKIRDAASNDVSLRPGEDLVADLPTAAREIKLLVPEKSFSTEGPEGALRVSYDDLNLLTILNMEPVPPHPKPHFPDWLNALENRRIRIRGFMYPAFLETGLRGFILVRDNQECCFGPGAKIYDHIEVFMREGVTTDYIPGRPFDVVGRFHIRPEADDEELYQLYQIEDALVIDD